MVEQEHCGRWFANGNAEDLAAWICELKKNPAAARSIGEASRSLLQRTATPELVSADYLKLIEKHLPKPFGKVVTTADQPSVKLTL
jgi:glycosyltransferase involved in cell wall biosynthesis